jgi:hypothetical protein
MKQKFVYLQASYLADLAGLISEEIEEKNEDGYFLADIKYSGLEDDQGDVASAYLLFNPIEE